MNKFVVRMRVALAAVSFATTAGLALALCAVAPCDGQYNQSTGKTVYTCQNGTVWYSFCQVWCCANNPGTFWYCNCNTSRQQLINGQPVSCSSGKCSQAGVTYPCSDEISCPT